MKKYVIMLVGILSFIGVSTVKADTFNYSYSGISAYYPSMTFDTYLNNLQLNSQVIDSLFRSLFSYYQENYQEEYPFYYLYFEKIYTNNIILDFFAFDNLPQLCYNSSSNSLPLCSASSLAFITLKSSFIDGTYNLPYVTSDSAYQYFSNNFTNGTYYLGHYFFSNFNLIFNSDSLDNITISNLPLDNSLILINEGGVIPTAQNLMNLNIISEPNSSSSNYTEIDLNNYSYVALSLKDYTEREEFYTNVEVQGQYCLTPVYDYGLTERKDVVTGSKVQACSPYYDNYTPVRTYILESDIKNHAIYYLKAYDTSRDNKVKVDTSIFNIHYITSEEADNPILNINGRNYTSIPYDDLTDSATISESEGYVSGASCAIGDINCTYDVLGGHSITDIFNKPLEFFKNLIESFVSVFELVISLIAVLPLPMQWFLYLSFTLAIALGIIKIIL